MFIKRKTTTEKAYAYGRLLSLRRRKLIKSYFDFMQDNCVCYEACFVGHNSENV